MSQRTTPSAVRAALRGGGLAVLAAAALALPAAAAPVDPASVGGALDGGAAAPATGGPGGASADGLGGGALDGSGAPFSAASSNPQGGATAAEAPTVEVAAKPQAAASSATADAVVRRARATLGAGALELALDLGDGIRSFAPAPDGATALASPARRPLGAPLLLLTATTNAGLVVRPSLRLDGRTVTLPRQALTLTRARSLIVRLRLTAAQRAAVAAARRPRLVLRLAAVDLAGERHEAVRTTALVA